MSLQKLLSDFARLCEVEATTVHPKPGPGHPDHKQRWSKNDRRHLHKTAGEAQWRADLVSDQCDCGAQGQGLFGFHYPGAIGCKRAT